MRAISLLLASPDIRVMAITVSTGALSSEDAYIKVRSMLNACHHEGIEVGINKAAGFESPEYKDALQAHWGEEKGLDPNLAPDCISLIKRVLSSAETTE